MTTNKYRPCMAGQHHVYWTWAGMWQRCTNPKGPSYKNYGGRGIRVCQRWKSFQVFLADMGPRPPGMSLDRINNDGNYEPSNCRWTTQREQVRNRRFAKKITHDGETLHVSEWEARLGLAQGAIWHRLKRGWTVSRALTTGARA